MKNRDDIKDFILGLEQQFPVNNWTCGGLHLWPFIRIRLFFYLIDRLEKQTSQIVGIDIKPLGWRDHLRGLASAAFYRAGMPNRHKKFVFASADAHYVNHEGVRFNRFFDPWLKDEKLAGESAILLYDSSAPDGRYRQENILRYPLLLEGYLYLTRNFAATKLEYDLSGYQEFLDVLDQKPLTQPFAKVFTPKSLVRFMQYDFHLRMRFFTKLWKRIQPEKVAMLCYYGSRDAYAMIAAANRLGIPTAELQHGPQTDIHLCYGNWNNLPATGYDVLPRTFWCWDDETAGVMRQWAGRNPLYRVEVTGNPWVEFWRGRSVDYREKGFVLYTLQTAPLTLETLFPPQLVSVIKQDARTWYIRLHPRQLKDMESIREYLSKLGIADKINLDNGTSDPLPLLLTHASLHLTHFSGSVIEAAQLGTPTILLHPTSLSSFPEILARGAAVYLDISSPDFATSFLNLSAKLSTSGMLAPAAHAVNPYVQDR